MANEFIIKNGYLSQGNSNVTGSLLVSGSIGAYNSGSDVLSAYGSQGNLLLVTDSMSGSLFTISDISGYPILDVTSNYYTSSVNIVGPLIVTANSFYPNTTVLDTFNKLLKDTSGNEAIDWTSRRMKDASSLTAIDWDGRALTDSISNPSINWENRILYASDGTTPSLNWSSSIITTSPTFFTHTISTGSQEDFSSTSNYAGVVIEGSTANGINLYNLVYLDTDGTWYQNNQATTASSKKLGIYLGNNLVLTEGHIVIDNNGSLGPTVQSQQIGNPIFIRSGAGTNMSCTPPSSGYVRILGHIYYQNKNTDPNLYIMRFNPSNDYYLLG